MGKIKLAIVDDHVLFRMGIQKFFKSHKLLETVEILFEANDGFDLLKYLDSGVAPDIILLDIAMPNMGGVKATAEVKKKYKNIKIIAFTMYAYSTLKGKYPDLELNGYLSKSDDPKTVILAINTVYNGGSFFPRDEKEYYLPFYPIISLP